MTRRMPVAVAVPLIAAALVGGALSGIYLVVATAPEPEPAPAAEIQEAFDRGMAAGVEYQEWFCQNTVETEIQK